ncbi:hypothetical protein BBF96_02575 [Anoxybacter fermentans]|uniref:Uncharacterized protein n=1 Tax=Anoxybacter fermentans TaxID=1323375 RepID=A0A3S9SVR8_9FIRM|nr:hypothetical protein [Anoxybacter fermentans]AZR72375.1 hypothetical protein BBF96_02575 [Anoxybacter fermentans]
MHEIPDLIGFELKEGLEYLKKKGLIYQLVEYKVPDQSYPSNSVRRIIRQRRLDTGEIEIVYCVDTYQLGKESNV